MKLTRLELLNFGSLKGAQSLDLSVSDESPVVLVHGENMRGKTTILRAIRFALYGEVRGHDGQPIQPEEFANYEVRDSEDAFDFGVTLFFEDRGSEIELKRTCHAVVTSDIAQRRVRVQSIKASLRPVDGNPIPEQDIEEFVNRTLHRDVADFFLFDGEMLTRFEESLRSDSTRAGTVKRSIERVLGLPALQLAKRDAEALLSDADAILRRAAKQKQNAVKIEADYSSKEAELQRLDKDVDELKLLRVDVDASVTQLGEELARVDSVKELYYRRKSLEEEVEDLKQDLADHRMDLRGRVAECWWAPMWPQISKRLDALTSQIDDATQALRNKDKLRFQIDQLKTRPGAHVCPYCEQRIDQDQENRLAEQLTDLEARLAALGDSSSDIGELHSELKRLRRYSAAEAASERITDAERDLERIRIRLAAKEEEISELNDDLRGTSLDIAAVEANFQDQRDKLRQIDRALQEAADQRDGLVGDIRRLSQELSKHAGASSPQRAERDTLDATVDTLERALDKFRLEMRDEVQTEASAIFKALSTEETYSGLRIDGRYYLEIIDENDHVIGRRSAGADQIVTMSLIGALVRCAVRQGPVVMDTPFGRLDKGHRERILRWVPTLGTQVILFVQSGEFDRDRDLQFLDGMIGREFTLRRVSATNTRIEKVTS